MTELNKFSFTEDISHIIGKSKGVTVPKTRAELISIALGTPETNRFEVSYDVKGKSITEATIVRCKNGVVVNYTDDYM